HVHPARILEAIAGEVDFPPLAIPQAHFHLAEVELGELTAHAPQAHHHLGRDRPPSLAEHARDGREPERSAALAEHSRYLAGRDPGVLLEKSLHPSADRFLHARPPHTSLGPGGAVVDYGDRILESDALHRAARYSQLLCHGSGRQSGPEQLVYG